MRVRGSSQTGISLIVQLAVLDVELADKRPDVRVMPVENRVDAHEVRPAGRGRIEVREFGPVWVRPPRPHEDGLDLRVVLQVGAERFTHGFAVA